MSLRPRAYWAIDPGESKAGLAWFHLYPRPCPVDDGLMHSTDRRLYLYRCILFRTIPALIEYTETNLHYARHLAIEEFRLYPWLARQQGFSSFGTAETIGVLKYIARRTGVPFTMQSASGSKKDGRKFAQQWGFPMRDRKLGSGKYTYYGPDFDIPGLQDPRDAAAHGCAYLGGHDIYKPRTAP